MLVLLVALLFAGTSVSAEEPADLGLSEEALAHRALALHTQLLYPTCVVASGETRGLATIIHSETQGRGLDERACRVYALTNCYALRDKAVGDEVLVQRCQPNKVLCGVTTGGVPGHEWVTSLPSSAVEFAQLVLSGRIAVPDYFRAQGEDYAAAWGAPSGFSGVGGMAIARRAERAEREAASPDRAIIRARDAAVGLALLELQAGRYKAPYIAQISPVELELPETVCMTGMSSAAAIAVSQGSTIYFGDGVFWHSRLDITPGGAMYALQGLDSYCLAGVSAPRCSQDFAIADGYYMADVIPIAAIYEFLRRTSYDFILGERSPEECEATRSESELDRSAAKMPTKP